ncbi:MAG: efflux RND transporter periplasmic adaptor subunit [Comamonas sp.]|jgi:membrane fusion protein, multidrug efflux system|nr:efflux RND transporter periplasmic adaptor subunit [Comamonas sp.]
MPHHTHKHSHLHRVPTPVHLRCLQILALSSIVTLTACSGDEGKTTGSTKAPPAQQVPVGVMVATPSEIGVLTELPGRVEASRVAQVRARTAGILQKRLFQEGSDVKAGQLLFQIDAAPYEAAVQNAQATLARAEANELQAATQFKRFKPLASAQAISQQDFDNAQASLQQAQAEIKAAQASLRTAQINLGYAKVSAPIAGRIGRALVTEGALVGQGEATPLAVVQQIDPVYINFTQPAAEAFQLRKALQSGALKSSGKEVATVQVVLEDGSLYAHSGKLLFTDLTVDSNTGQMALRAEVPNPDGLLLPGLYVRIRMEQAQADNAIALPQQAVTRTDQGNFVTVVDAAGKTERRAVQITMARNNQWLVQSGLQAGEQVMVDGFQKLQMLPPGTLVKAVPWQAPNTVPSTSTAPANTAPKAD